MAQVETEKSGYSGFERFLYLFFIPVVFTVILTVVLLNMFGYNVMDSVLRAANKVPLLEYVVPDPKEKPANPNDGADAVAVNNQEELNKIADLEQELEQELLNSQSKSKLLEQLNEQIAALSAEIEEAKEAKVQNIEDLRSLAKVYSEMSPSKAAPVLSQMGTNDRMLIMSQMKPADQKRILEKMDPAVAAETTLQQLAEYRGESVPQQELDEKTIQTLTAEEVSRTIAGMNTGSAAKLLLELVKTNEAKTLQILRGMDLRSRSAIMTELSNASEKTAAQLTAKLDG